jgi:HD-GYP domain-containing protein (c-di-GMP phosphodiesterase class II)
MNMYNSIKDESINLKEVNFVQQFIASDEFSKLQALLKKGFGEVLCWVFPPASLERPLYYSNFPACHCNNSKIVTKEFSRFRLTLKDFHDPKISTCSHDHKMLCAPLIIEQELVAVVVLCHIRSNALTNNAKYIISKIINCAAESVYNRIKIARFNEIMKSRLVALSTLHTIHRLTASTFEIEELLPRIARLACQVMHTQQCRILLSETHEENLTVKVDITDNELKKNTKATALEKEVLVSGDYCLHKDLIIIPLIDVDMVGVITLRGKIDGAFDRSSYEIMSTFAEQVVIVIKNAQLYREQEKLVIGMVKSLAAILDTRGKNTYVHTPSFVRLSLEMGRELGLAGARLRLLYYACLLHDAGRVAIPEAIFKKTSKLTDFEYNIIKTHPVKAAEILKPLDILKPAVPIVLHHHERYDGKGYPDGLKGKDIPLESRIMAVAGAFEAMISRRPYRRSPVTIDKAIIDVKQNSGTQFDPDVVNAFLRVVAQGKLKPILEGFGKKQKK